MKRACAVKENVMYKRGKWYYRKENGMYIVQQYREEKEMYRKGKWYYM